MSGQITGEGTSWGVVLLADEPEALVLANLCWHLEQGAQEVHLYLDAPDSPAARAVMAQAAALPGIRITACDKAFWRALNGARPALQTRRQTLIATQAYQQSRTAWLLHLDADEFLWLPKGKAFAQELVAADKAAAFLALPNLERAYTRPEPLDLFEGVFRVPIPAHAPLPGALAHQAPFVARGLPGHAGGKACTRIGLGASLQPHAPRIDGERPASAPAGEAVVLHFDGLTPLHWLIKLRRYAAHDPAQWERFLAPHRRAQLAFMRAHQGDARALHAFHDRLKQASPLPALEAQGLVRRLAFDPAQALSHWLAKVPDLSAQGFDAALRRNFPDLSAGL
ncbi:MAG TPA: hypothetical protein GX700_05405 [Paracoccus sp.]|nr:hypothetical protein [Paracoccus sp. (in: a-proteobacteria)]